MTAKESYKNHRKEIDKLIGDIQEALTDMDEVQRDNPKDWGYVGNVAEIESMLAEIIKFSN